MTELTLKRRNITYMELELRSFASGSSGNCYLIKSENTSLILDAGLSAKRICEGLAACGTDPKDVGAILITHEHTDHTKGVGILMRKLKVPLYATIGTITATDIGSVDDSLIHEISHDITYDINGIGITPFSIPHDAADPCGFILNDGTSRIATATDIGIMTDGILSRLYGCDSVLLESNHDIDMLRYGDYPYALKQRILSDTGHLSNKAAAEAALKLVQNGTKHLMLGHLSDKNNMPTIAQMETYSYLTDNGLNVGGDVTLKVAQRYDITEF